MKGVYARGLEEPYVPIARKAVACLPPVWSAHAWVPVVLSYREVTVAVRHPFLWQARHHGFTGPQERVYQGGIAIHAYLPPVTYREQPPYVFSSVRGHRLTGPEGTERVIRAVARAIANAVEQVKLDMPRERLWRRLEALEGAYPYLWSIVDQIERSGAPPCDPTLLNVEGCAFWQEKLDSLRIW